MNAALDRADTLIDLLEKGVESPNLDGASGDLLAGVDLGTAYMVVAVVDEIKRPVTARYCYAEVVRDGLVVDFTGAVRTVRRLKHEIENALGRELSRAAGAYPPGTGRAAMNTVRYVCESAGFEATAIVDEPTAANNVLGIRDGAVVDIGGGTTGIAVVRNGEVVYTADEPTGGTHFTLVIAGAYKIPFAEAEAIKTDPSRQAEIVPLVKPVIQKVSSIIIQHTRRFKVDVIYLVGGTSCLAGIERIVEQETGIRTLKPRSPLLVTPLGIAMSCA
ncbi:MAG: ethanolamine utilization protein EutJ [Firmicutes bacterium]|nr:ethanolamine utilization protein EutJ [Bacillota bacterium]